MRLLIILLLLLFTPLVHAQKPGMFFAKPDVWDTLATPLSISNPMYLWYSSKRSPRDSIGNFPANNSGVATLKDLSGNGYDAVQSTSANRPLFKSTSGPSSTPICKWDNSDDYLLAPSRLWSADSITIILVGRFAASTADQGIFLRSSQIWFYGYNSGGPCPTIHTYGEDTWSKYRSWSSPSVFTSFSVVYISTTTNDGTGADFYVDGSAVSESYSVFASGLAGINDKSTATNIGGGSSGWYSSLELCELIVFEGKFTSSQRLLIEEYIQNEWGL